MTVKPLVPVSRTAHVLGTAALLDKAVLDDLGSTVTCATPDAAAKLVLDAAAPEIQRATARHFAELRTGGWSLFFMALWLPILAAVLIEIAINGTTMNRVLAGLAIVGLTLSILLMRRSQSVSKRRAEALMRRADGDNWRTNGWAPGEREAVRVLITEGLRLPWPLPAPTTTPDGVRNLIAMLRVAESRATASESQIGKIRIVLDEPRGMSTGAQLAEIRDVVTKWRDRAAAYDDDADAVTAPLVDAFGCPGTVGFVLDGNMTGGMTVQIDITGTGDLTDDSRRVEVVNPDGKVLGTIVGADASELSSPTAGITFRDVEPDGTADPDEHPWKPGELSGELPPRADVDAAIADADRRRADVADGIRDGIAGLGADADPTRASRVLGLVDAWQSDRAGRPLDLGDADADRLRGDRDRLVADQARIDPGLCSTMPFPRPDAVVTDDVVRANWEAPLRRPLDTFDGFGAPISSPAPEPTPDRSSATPEPTSSGDTSTSTSPETGSTGPSD